jgi:hypothetical protein
MSRAVFGFAVAALILAPLGARSEDTPKAEATRKVLKSTKLTVDFDDARLEEIMEELKEKVPGFKFMLDSKGGVSRNSKLTYKAKDQTVEEILTGVCKKGGDLGWYVISVKNNAYDGLVKITKGGERGYEKGKEPK